MLATLIDEQVSKFHHDLTELLNTRRRLLGLASWWPDSSGAIKIAPDDEWRSQLAPRKRMVATAIALPLLHRYGLPVRSAAPAPGAAAQASSA